MTNLLLIGNNRIFRQALAIVVPQRLPECSIRAQAGTYGEGALVLAQDIPIDVTVVDHDGPEEDLVELMTRLRSYRPGAAILAVVDAAGGRRQPCPGKTENTRVLDRSASLDEILGAVQELARAAGERARVPLGSRDRAHRRTAADARLSPQAPRRCYDPATVMHSGRSAPGYR